MDYFNFFSVKSKNNSHPASGKYHNDDAALFNSIVQSIYSAILVISLSGKVIYANDKFGKLWRISKWLINEKNDRKLLKFVIKELVNPKEFIKKVNYLYKHKEL